jgi:hypothetical protein
MPVEMFPLLPKSYQSVAACDCRLEADHFQEGGEPEIEPGVLSPAGGYFWRTIRDLMLSGI